MAAEFRASFDEMAHQSELDDLRKEVDALRSGATSSMGLGGGGPRGELRRANGVRRHQRWVLSAARV